MFSRLGRYLTAISVSPSVAAFRPPPSYVSQAARWHPRHQSSVHLTVPGEGRIQNPEPHGNSFTLSKPVSYETSSTDGDLLRTADRPEDEDSQIQRLISENASETVRDAPVRSHSSDVNDHLFRPSSDATDTEKRLTRMQIALNERKRTLRHRIRERLSTRSGGWAEFARALEHIVPQPNTVAQRVIQLSTDTLATYAGSRRPNSWIEHIGTGVHVRVPSVSDIERPSSTRPVVLQGSRVQMDKVEKKLHALKAIEPSNLYNVDDVAHPISAGLTLKSINSLDSFRRYVHRITARRRHHHQEKSIVANQNRYTAQRLVTAFADPRISRYASTVALNSALRYLNCHYELRGAANRIYAHGWRMGLVADISTMNLRLGFAVRHNMAMLANSTVRDMSELGVSPNSHTWSLLYYMSPHPAERLELVRSMDRARVPVSREARARFALFHIEQQLTVIRNDQPKWRELVAEMDNSFGRREWLTASTFKRLLHQAKIARLPHVFEDLVDLAWEHQPSQVIEAHVHCLFYFRSRRDLTRAVSFLKALADRDAKEVNFALVVPAVYMTAWDLKATNVCRILWTFAAVRGILSDTMRQTMVKSLYPEMLPAENSQDMSDARKKTVHWRQVCARAVSGIETDFLMQIREDYPRLMAQFPDAKSHIEMISEWSSNDEVKTDQIALIKAMHYRDLQAWKKYGPTTFSRLVSSLAEAQHLDYEWMKTGKVFSMSVEEARRDSLVLPIAPKTQDQLRRDEQGRQDVLADATVVHTELKEERPRSMRHVDLSHHNSLITETSDEGQNVHVDKTIDAMTTTSVEENQ